MAKIMTRILLMSMAVCLSFGLAGSRGRAAESSDQPAIPAASGTALWAYLMEVDYTRAWKMWPGTKALYPGKSPHGAYLTTYVNGAALKAIELKTGSMPYEAIICKQNFDKNKNYVALTVMYKVKGYNPPEGDYFWAKYSPDGKVEAEGKISSCINCHSHQRQNDFIFTSSLK